MSQPRPARAVVLVRVLPLRLWLTAWAAALVIALGALQAMAEQKVTVAHGISTFGELKYPADFLHLDYVNPDAPKGGEISIWAFGSFDSMHPYTTKGRSGALSNGFFESLLTGTADEAGSAYGLLAESVEYPEDRSWAVFTLRPEARFSDGSPVTAEDVVFSFELFRDKGLPSFRVQLSRQVESAEVLEDGRVKFTFKADAPKRDLPQLVGGLPVFSKAHYESTGRDFEESSLEPLLGSGPYVLKELDVGQTIVYERDPYYWGASLPINVGRNNFDRIRIEYYADYNAAFEGFKGGTYTFRNEASSKSWATGYDFPAVQNGWIKKVELPDGNLATGQSFAFNLRRPQFQDPRVREAIGLMFNFEWSNETLFYGIYARINSFWENSYLAAEGMPAEGERALLEPLVADGLLPGTILTEPAVMAPTSGNRQLDRGNLRAASALLDEAGWIVGEDGMRRKDGQTLRVEFLNDSQTFDRVINPYVENLRRLGVDAVHTRVDNAQATNRERSYDFDVITAQFPMDYIPGSGLRQYFGSETADSSVFNSMGLKSEAVDRLIENVLAAQSDAELTTAVKALDRVLRAERFWVPQWYKNTHTVAYYDMYEHPDPLPPYALGNLDFWWYNAEKAQKLRAAGAIR
ncbi:extracellular solute-binding protein [Rhodovulum marinum]|uniref:Microcin C transport system substrate-binding protein n=1 Tax=Rhodovulum marinum TaxID=320662 RepID=A0A4R2Q6F7_9RHOB|nr:extracellular solute-binding protein [Rhodovulum marinum]TCP44412.1 microcin C transport system substrate-binding protein [Rhodovulum marinum]